MSELPKPSPEALAHSARLVALISEEIIAHGGWLPFTRYMELALYAPGLGYYTAGARKFGVAGDFVTAPELSSLFGRTLARQLVEMMAASAPHILELGAGSGKLAVDVLSELEALGALPESYAILEVSADLRQRQQQLIAGRLPHLADRVRWLEALPDEISGAVIGNEVLDALPVHLVRWLEAAAEGEGAHGEASNFSEDSPAPAPPPAGAGIAGTRRITRRIRPALLARPPAQRSRPACRRSAPRCAGRLPERIAARRQRPDRQSGATLAAGGSAVY